MKKRASTGNTPILALAFFKEIQLLQAKGLRTHRMAYTNLHEGKVRPSRPLARRGDRNA